MEKNQGRVRKIRLEIRVTKEEKLFIQAKMKLLKTKNMGAYMRKMAIDGEIKNYDFTEIKNMNAELYKIGVNLNQIAKRINSTYTMYDEDMTEVKDLMNTVWRLQKSALKKLIE